MNIIGNTIINEDIHGIIANRTDWTYISGKTVLVTGANGFIPSYIVYTLLQLNEDAQLETNCKVLALVRDREKAEKRFKNFLQRSDFELIVSDVTEPFSYERTVDIIIHAASQASPKYYGKDPVGTLKANTIGTANLLDFALEHKTEKFIYISSNEVYGVVDSSSGVITEENTGNVDITNIRSCYAESKRMGETMCISWAAQYGLHVNMLRLSHTYGPGVSLTDGRVFADFVNNIVHNQNITLNSDGSARRSFMYITDMIQALFSVLFKAPTCQAYNISAGTDTSIRELAELLCALYPEKQLKVCFTHAQAAGYIPSKTASITLSTDKIKQLGWEQIVPVEMGFKRMIDSYKEE